MPQMVGYRARNVTGGLISEPKKVAQKVAQNRRFFRNQAEFDGHWRKRAYQP